jgi:hypothetical protein
MASKKVLVAIKRVIDYNARVRVKPDKVCAASGRQHAQPPALARAFGWLRRRPPLLLMC